MIKCLPHSPLLSGGLLDIIFNVFFYYRFGPGLGGEEELHCLGRIIHIVHLNINREKRPSQKSTQTHHMHKFTHQFENKIDYFLINESES